MRFKGIGGGPLAGLRNINLEGLRFRFVDAEDQVVGRLASQLAVVLQGKDKPIFAPNRDLGDVCVVVNASKVVLTGRKWDDKMYVTHTGTPGGRKETPAKEAWRKDPSSVLRRAVANMLPKNVLRKARMRKLRLFEGPEHAFQGFPLVPFGMPARNIRDSRMGWPMPDEFDPMNPAGYARRMRGSKWAHPAAAAARLPPVPPLSFEDLLSVEERALVAAWQLQQQQQQQQQQQT